MGHGKMNGTANKRALYIYPLPEVPQRRKNRMMNEGAVEILKHSFRPPFNPGPPHGGVASVTGDGKAKPKSQPELTKPTTSPAKSIGNQNRQSNCAEPRESGCAS